MTVCFTSSQKLTSQLNLLHGMRKFFKNNKGTEKKRNQKPDSFINTMK